MSTRTCLSHIRGSGVFFRLLMGTSGGQLMSTLAPAGIGRTELADSMDFSPKPVGPPSPVPSR